MVADTRRMFFFNDIDPLQVFLHGENWLNLSTNLETFYSFMTIRTVIHLAVHHSIQLTSVDCLDVRRRHRVPSFDLNKTKASGDLTFHFLMPGHSLLWTYRSLSPYTPTVFECFRSVSKDWCG